MKKSLLVATALAAMIALPATAGTYGTVITPTVEVPPPPPPPGRVSHWPYVAAGVVVLCVLLCGDSENGTPATPGS